MTFSIPLFSLVCDPAEKLAEQTASKMTKPDRVSPSWSALMPGARCFNSTMKLSFGIAPESLCLANNTAMLIAIADIADRQRLPIQRLASFTSHACVTESFPTAASSYAVVTT